MMSPQQYYCDEPGAFPQSATLGASSSASSDLLSDSIKDESVDSILAHELNKLTFHERESINEEIHGINIDRKYIEESGAVEETPDILSKSLKDMQSELDILGSTEGGVGGTAWAFNRSQELFECHPDGTYFNTAEFRLMFLRCERFDCKKAAKRLCLYADLMFESYGDFALGRPPRLSDLDGDDMEWFNKGSSMSFPGRDRAGRRIYMLLGDNSQPSDRSRLRIAAYCIMSMLSHDVDSQRRGIVAVMWMHNVTNMDLAEFVRKGKTQSRHLASIPVRVGAGHYCFRTSEIAKSAAFFQIISRFTGQVRPHVRIHSGKQFPRESNCGTLSLADLILVLRYRHFF
mmetsp:Transcript_17312/g.43209  ORF Transcript_17312/g.43209 Transcript_17312/m.43209 type:complete len:345 (+) Transcript_17312:230-1264(+)